MEVRYWQNQAEASISSRDETEEKDQCTYTPMGARQERDSAQG